MVGHRRLIDRPSGFFGRYHPMKKVTVMLIFIMESWNRLHSLSTHSSHRSSLSRRQFSVITQLYLVEHLLASWRHGLVYTRASDDRDFLLRKKTRISVTQTQISANRYQVILIDYGENHQTKQPHVYAKWNGRVTSKSTRFLIRRNTPFGYTYNPFKVISFIKLTDMIILYIFILAQRYKGAPALKKPPERSIFF